MAPKEKRAVPANRSCPERNVQDAGAWFRMFCAVVVWATVRERLRFARKRVNRKKKRPAGKIEKPAGQRATFARFAKWFVMNSFNFLPPSVDAEIEDFVHTSAVNVTSIYSGDLHFD